MSFGAIKRKRSKVIAAGSRDQMRSKEAVMARRKRRRSFGFTMPIPQSAYKKVMAKSKGRGQRSKHLTNRDRAVIEMYRFQHRKASAPIHGYLKGYKVTNWTGLKLCDVTRRKSARQGFPGYFGKRPERVHIQARCGGRMYVGSGPGDGMYVTLRPKRGR